MRINKSKQAQQLIEFMLVAPFMIIILGILTEYAYAFNINMTLNQGLKTVASSIYSEIDPGMNTTAIRNQVKTNLETYLDKNNAPTKDGSGNSLLSVGYTIIGQTAVFNATYTYTPAFTLPNVYFKILPNTFVFFTTCAVPSAFIGDNTAYSSSGLLSTDLDSIWAGTASFSSLDAFNASKRGIMTTSVGSNPVTQKTMLFLIPDSVTPTNYYVTHWNGTVDDCVFNSNTGLISGAGCGAYNGGKLINYLKGNNYYNVIFIHDSDVPITVNTSTLAGVWLAGSGKISDSTADGILKRALALIDNGNSSIGNYDNLSVSSYSDVSDGNDYTIENFGSMVFAYTSADNIANIINGLTDSNYGYTYNFGSGGYSNE